MRVFIPPFRKAVCPEDDQPSSVGAAADSKSTPSSIERVKIEGSGTHWLRSRLMACCVLHENTAEMREGAPRIPPTTAAGRTEATGPITSSEFLGYKVLYTKRSLKKRKRYNDGILLVKAGSLVLINDAGTDVAKLSVKRGWSDDKGPGSTLVLGNFELELCERILKEDYSSGRSFINNCESSRIQINEPQAKATRRFRTPAQSHHLYHWRETSTKEVTVPPGALQIAVWEEPTGAHQPIWIDAFLNTHLRPHQKEGVCWMYSQLLKGEGCILADTMGLGKTIQALSLLWVAVSQPAWRRPLASKCCVVCPASLVGNWTHEIKKWLGNRITFLVASGDGKETKTTLQQFAAANTCKLVIISYDQLRKLSGSITSSIDMLICDEGHRLKSSRTQTARNLLQLPCKHRIILSGTPLQNDVDELHACCSFVRPGAMPDHRIFAKVFKEPILKARLPTATMAEKQLGKIRVNGVSAVQSRFMLRRTDEVLIPFVPPKKTIAIFVNLVDRQKLIYEAVCNPAQAAQLSVKGRRQLDDVMRAILSNPLYINARRKRRSPFSNQLQGIPDTFEDAVFGGSAGIHPSLIGRQGLSSCVWPDCETRHSISPSSQVVIVSNFTSTLDSIEIAMLAKGYTFLRLDGSTLVKERTGIVQSFNESKEYFAFLLSSKAGGVGLNLTGANRLILVDPDWNPANDKQALSRVWRPGQKNPVYIYRLIGARTIEERILQRQRYKTTLSEVALRVLRRKCKP
ncbi:SNF2 family N-terminal domain-containing protein [Besnoitia besnoiti]|uniref:SNF2 family N-terminal domain-containing protein n=1 Tax=Besnoitia besnoiti TaxID=94643 RepID=A0A2A9MJ01_BESBE|nr:SNF2 family N-terminal domain-containing protein [Besnoitia besnoiti]PFH35946.1 SNF2 family N-terminal domain-containing protein [Besnoitia besnoiti]